MKKYLQVYDKLKSDVINGAYPLKTKLPSKRETAEKFCVSVATVEHAYELLISEGFIESKERSGYFSVYTADSSYLSEPTNEQPRQPTTSLEQSSSDFPFSVYAVAVRGVLNDYGKFLFEKSPNGGLSELKSAIKNYLRRNRGIFVDEDRIVVGSGAEYLYGMIIELLGKNRTYAIEDPSYDQIENVYAAKGAKIIKLKLCEGGINSADLNGANADVLHVTPFRSYPTGVTANASKKTEYLKWAKRRNGYLIEDDYQSEFSLTSKPADTIFGADDENVIYLNTFSATFCPGLRVGYMLLPEKLADSFYEKLGFYSCTVPTLEQLVLARVINDGTFERHINRVRRARRKGKNKE